MSASTRAVLRYHPALVALHWLLAALITAALAIGALKMVEIPNTDPLKLEALRTHMAGGAFIGALMLVRLFVRTGTARPAPATAGQSGLDALAWASHRLFYLLVLAMPASGLAMALQAGLFDIVYGGQGHLPPDLWVFSARWVHYAISRTLMALIGLHVAGALYHTFVLRDGLLRRMAFGRRVPVDRAASAARPADPSSEKRNILEVKP